MRICQQLFTPLGEPRHLANVVPLSNKMSNKL